MKFINRATMLTAVLALSAGSAWAQAKECNDDFKTTTYSKWYDNRTGNQDLAYEAAKEYLSVCTTEDQYSVALKKFVDAYDKLHSNQKLAADFDAAVKAKNYADQIRLGKQLVAMPLYADNAVIYLLMAGAGLGDPNLMGESAQAAKKAIELLEAGKTFDKSGYTSKDHALASMNYLLAKSVMKTSPTDAIPYYIKAAKYQSDLQKSPVIYNELATAYGEGPLDKLAKEYKALADAGKSVDSPETKLVVANMNQVLDRQIDAFARAASASTAAADKDAFKKVLTDVYKDRNKKDPAPGEIDSLVATALNKPLPDAPTPITTLPTQSSGTTPTGSGAAPAGSAPSTSMPTNGGTGSPASSSSATATKPASTTNGTGAGPAPAKPTSTPKPKPRRNHRG